MATRASSKRKRASHPATPADSPAARRARGGGAAAAAAAEPPTLVDVGGDWSTAMQTTRESGKFLDVTLLAGQRKIEAHAVAK